MGQQGHPLLAGGPPRQHAAGHASRQRCANKDACRGSGRALHTCTHTMLPARMHAPPHHQTRTHTRACWPSGVRACVRASSPSAMVRETERKEGEESARQGGGGGATPVARAHQRARARARATPRLALSPFSALCIIPMATAVPKLTVTCVIAASSAQLSLGGPKSHELITRTRGGHNGLGTAHTAAAAIP